MANYAILRLRKRTLQAARAMAAHALRERPTPNADKARAGENRVWPARATAAKVIERLSSMTEPLVKRKDAVRCIEVFIGASPEAMRAMDRAAQVEYLSEATAWVAKRFGGAANVALAVMHFDETTPHLQVLLAPIERDQAGAAVRLTANRMIGGPAGLRSLQDAFAAEVGARHGLRRGERGSGAKHSSIRAFYGAIEAAGRADALPPRFPVPAPLPEPGMLSTKAAREAHAKRERERKEAMDANRRRQAEIERLAGLALATHGRRRRRLPKALSEAEATIVKAEKLRAEVAQLKAEVVRLSQLRAEIQSPRPKPR